MQIKKKEETKEKLPEKLNIKFYIFYYWVMGDKVEKKKKLNTSFSFIMQVI